MSKVDKFSPYHDGSMQFDIDGGWVSYDDYKESADRIEELEAKLDKAVAVAEKSIGWLRLYGANVQKEATTLAELKGQDDG